MPDVSVRACEARTRASLSGHICRISGNSASIEDLFITPLITVLEAFWFPL